jgi:cell fate (sporulation/competence/biofilm development) regulator YlbF (YheA/YmcA/DUF963 family)
VPIVNKSPAMPVESRITMDSVILAARELGKALQADERYIRYSATQQVNDGDEALQKMIAKFSAKRETLQGEIGKEDRDMELVNRLNAEASELYGQIFQNRSMVEFAAARDEVQQLLAFVNQIITGSSNGLDPDTIEYQAECGGSCSSCAGCN